MYWMMQAACCWDNSQLLDQCNEKGLVSILHASTYPPHAHLHLSYCCSLQWRTQFRRQMNRAESQASSRAVDSLINYETVKYFDAEEHEKRR